MTLLNRLPRGPPLLAARPLRPVDVAYSCDLADFTGRIPWQRLRGCGRCPALRVYTVYEQVRVFNHAG